MGNSTTDAESLVLLVGMGMTFLTAVATALLARAGAKRTGETARSLETGNGHTIAQTVEATARQVQGLAVSSVMLTSEMGAIKAQLGRVTETVRSNQDSIEEIKAEMGSVHGDLALVARGSLEWIDLTAEDNPAHVDERARLRHALRTLAWRAGNPRRPGA